MKSLYTLSLFVCLSALSSEGQTNGLNGGTFGIGIGAITNTDGSITISPANGRAAVVTISANGGGGSGTATNLAPNLKATNLDLTGTALNIPSNSFNGVVPPSAISIGAVPSQGFLNSQGFFTLPQGLIPSRQLNYTLGSIPFQQISNAFNPITAYTFVGIEPEFMVTYACTNSIFNQVLITNAYAHGAYTQILGVAYDQPHNTWICAFNTPCLMVFANDTAWTTRTPPFTLLASNTPPNPKGFASFWGISLYQGSIKWINATNALPPYLYTIGDSVIRSFDAVTLVSNMPDVVLQPPNGSYTNGYLQPAYDLQSNIWVSSQSQYYTNGLTPTNCITEFSSNGTWIQTLGLDGVISNCQGFCFDTNHGVFLSLGQDYNPNYYDIFATTTNGHVAEIQRFFTLFGPGFIANTLSLMYNSLTNLDVVTAFDWNGSNSVTEFNLAPQPAFGVGATGDAYAFNGISFTNSQRIAPNAFTGLAVTLPNAQDFDILSPGLNGLYILPTSGDPYIFSHTGTISFTGMNLNGIVSTVSGYVAITNGATNVDLLGNNGSNNIFGITGFQGPVTFKFPSAATVVGSAGFDANGNLTSNAPIIVQSTNGYIQSNGIDATMVYNQFTKQLGISSATLPTNNLAASGNGVQGLPLVEGSGNQAVFTNLLGTSVLGTGTQNTSTFLRGDGTWASISNYTGPGTNIVITANGPNTNIFNVSANVLTNNATLTAGLRYVFSNNGTANVLVPTYTGYWIQLTASNSTSQTAFQPSTNWTLAESNIPSGVNIFGIPALATSASNITMNIAASVQVDYYNDAGGTGIVLGGYIFSNNVVPVGGAWGGFGLAGAVGTGRSWSLSKSMNMRLSDLIGGGASAAGVTNRMLRVTITGP